MYNYLTNLITKKYYETKAEAEEKVSVLFSVNMLTSEQCVELMTLAGTTYPAE